MSDENRMSQDEIENMLRDAGQIDETEIADNTQEAPGEEYLTQKEKDTLGEVGNICMGAAATTMFTLMDKNTNITTPKISFYNPESLSKEFPVPLVLVDVDYTQGISGKNVLILEEYDVAVMTNRLMGSEEEVSREGIELDDMHLSAIREVMNQMVGSSATSLSKLLNSSIDISTPNARHILLDRGVIKELFDDDQILVKVAFDMEIEDLLSTKIMQIYTLEFARQMVNKVIKEQVRLKELGEENSAITIPKEAEETHQAAQSAPSMPPSAPSAPMQQAPSAPSAPMQQVPSAPVMPPNSFADTSSHKINPAATSNYSEVEYPNFDNSLYDQTAPRENISLLANVPMNVSVELGKSKKKIKEILEFNNGSVIVLDKLAGEPVDLLVNGKHIAKGEVVVVDDSYGVRITEINSAVINGNI